jgi:hypothetical protein
MPTPTTRRGRPAKNAVDPVRLVEILVDAACLGDTLAAQKWKITTRTVERYRVRAAADPQLSGPVAEKIRVETPDWATVRLRFLIKATAKLEMLVEKAQVENMRDVTGAVKIIGELHVVVGQLGETSKHVEQPDAPLAGQGPAPNARREPAGGAAADGTGGVH